MAYQANVRIGYFIHNIYIKTVVDYVGLIFRQYDIYVFHHTGICDVAKGCIGVRYSDWRIVKEQ